MAQDTRITGVYEIKIEQGPALRAFEEVKKKLDNTKAAIRELNKENKALIQQENELTAAIKRDGVATSLSASLHVCQNRRSPAARMCSTPSCWG